jgi:Mn-dependent DtxR family transcriptional regulator
MVKIMVVEIRLPLTSLQTRVLAFVYDFIHRKLYPPTVKEIQEVLAISNPGTVYKALAALNKKGYIVKEKHIARSVRLTPLGEEVCAQSRQLNLELEKFQSLKNL